MSTLLGKENPNHSSSAFIDNVVSGNSNASSAASSPDDFDDDSAGNSTTPTTAPTPTPAFKANSIAAAATATSNILTNLSRLNAHHLSAAAAATSNANYRKDMGGFSIPHHGLSAAFYGYHSHASQLSNECLPPPPPPPSTTTTTSITSGNLSPVQHHGHHHHHHHHHHPSYSPTSGSNGTVSQQGNASTITNLSSSSSHATANALNNSSFNSSKSSPFLLPAQLYKSLFANAVLHSPDKMCSHPFPRNLLFSYSDKSPNSPDFDNDEKPSITSEVSFLFFSICIRLWRRRCREESFSQNKVVMTCMSTRMLSFDFCEQGKIFHPIRCLCLCEANDFYSILKIIYNLDIFQLQIENAQSNWMCLFLSLFFFFILRPIHK